MNASLRNIIGHLCCNLFMVSRCGWRLFWLAFAISGPSRASTDLTLNFSGVTSQILNGHSATGPGSGTITPYGNANVNFSANGSSIVTVSITVSLASGDYFQATTQSASGDGNTVSGTATIVGSTGQFIGLSGTLNFTLTFTASATAGTFTLTGYGSLGAGQQTLVVSQSGVRFQVTQGDTAPPPQTIFVANPGAGSLAFTAAGSTLSGNSTWLSVTPTAGSSTTATPGALNISVDPTGLAAGNYYGLVNISAPDAANSPQLVEVVLNVVAMCTSACLGGTPDVLVSPTGLIFVAQAGSNPAPQTVQVANSSDGDFPLSTQVTFQQGNGWFSVPATADLPANQSLPLSVSVNVAGLTPGIYNGTLQVEIDAAGVFNYPVAILLVLLPEPSSSQFRPHTSGSAACTPTQLLPVFTLLGNSFTTPAAWPAPLQVDVVDDCGEPMIAGSVAATFSSGDPALALASIGGGNWSGTWAPHSLAGAQVTITVNAQLSSPALTGTMQISGSVSPNSNIPVISTVGVVSAASFTSLPVAPGGFISIFGSDLGTGLNSSSTLPLAKMLGGTAAVIGGELLPLQFTSDGQINAIVPYDIPDSGTQQLLIQQNAAYSLPEPLTMAAAQPAVFTQDQSGQGAGIIVVVKPNQTQFLATPATPATAGDALVIYCAGLGAVNPAIPAGSAAPASPLSTTVNTTTVMIGNQPANVLYSGLAPGFAGLYQVNVTVPSGITPGSDVPVVLTVAGISSPTVTVAIQ
jgi:uncharacterized protein (TIGR03437 family)